MTVTLRQHKIVTGTATPGGSLNLTPDLATETGNLIVMIVRLDGDYNPHALNLGSTEYILTASDPALEDMNAFAGLGSLDAVRSDLVPSRCVVYSGPAQPGLGPDYTTLTFDNALVGDEEFEAVLYEFTSDTGPIVSWAQYNVDAVDPGDPAYNIQDWFAVYTGYDKPRMVLTLAVTPPEVNAPAITGATGVELSSPTNFTVKLDNVEWAGFEEHPISMTEAGYLGFVVAVVEQSRHNVIQTGYVEYADSFTPDTPVTAGNLLLLSTNSEYPSMEGWDLLSKSSPSSGGPRVTTFWKQASDSEPGAFSVNDFGAITFREVDGFDDGVLLATRASMALDLYALGYEYLGVSYEEFMREYGGFIEALPPLPENDAFFFSAVAFAETVPFSMTLPDPTLQLDRSLIDAGEGWDFYPDGVQDPYYGSLYGMYAQIMAFGSGVNGSDLYEVDYVAVGAVFVNGVVPVQPTPDPTGARWLRVQEPSTFFMFSSIESLTYSIEQAINRPLGLRGYSVYTGSNGVYDLATTLDSGYGAHVVCRFGSTDPVELIMPGSSQVFVLTLAYQQTPSAITWTMPGTGTITPQFTDPIDTSSLLETAYTTNTWLCIPSETALAGTTYALIALGVPSAEEISIDTTIWGSGSAGGPAYGETTVAGAIQAISDSLIP